MLYSRIKTNSITRIAVLLGPRERFRGEGLLCFPHVRRDPAHGGSVNNGNIPTLSPATVGPIRIHTFCSRKKHTYSVASKRKKRENNSVTRRRLPTFLLTTRSGNVSKEHFFRITLASIDVFTGTVVSPTFTRFLHQRGC